MDLPMQLGLDASVWNRSGAGGLLAEFFEYLRNECNLAPRTAYAYEHSLKRLVIHCDKPLEELDSRDVRHFLRQSHYAPASKAITVAALKSFHKWGALEEHWSLNGIMSVRGPRLIHNVRPSLPSAMVADLLSITETPNQYRLVYLGLFAGLRVSESASITEDAWHDDRLRFMGKGRKVREVPVHPQLERMKGRVLMRTPSLDGSRAAAGRSPKSSAIGSPRTRCAGRSR